MSSEQEKAIAKEHPRTVSLPQDYAELLEDFKTRIRCAQIRAAVSANRELTLLYWDIGRQILVRQESEGWGAKVIERLSMDLRRDFPDMKGFSARNLLFMRSFAESYPDQKIVKQLVSQIPWGHNIRILQRVKDSEERFWYAKKVLEHGWSRNILVMQIESNLYARQGKAVRNFESTRPSP